MKKLNEEYFDARETHRAAFKKYGWFIWLSIFAIIIYFIVLEISFQKNGVASVFCQAECKVVDECNEHISNARIYIYSESGGVREVYSNADGDFLIDSIKIGRHYRIMLNCTSFFTEELSFVLKKDTNMLICMQHIPINVHSLPFVYFDFNSAEPITETLMNLEGIVDVLVSDPSLVLNVVGYKDLKEDDSIASKRIDAVISRLVEQGFKSNRFKKEPSSTPNEIEMGEAVYDCRSKEYRQEVELLTEEYILKSTDAEQQQKLRQMNRSVVFTVFSD